MDYRYHAYTGGGGGVGGANDGYGRPLQAQHQPTPQFQQQHQHGLGQATPPMLAFPPSSMSTGLPMSPGPQPQPPASLPPQQHQDAGYGQPMGTITPAQLHHQPFQDHGTGSRPQQAALDTSSPIGGQAYVSPAQLQHGKPQHRSHGYMGQTSSAQHGQAAQQQLPPPSSSTPASSPQKSPSVAPQSHASRHLNSHLYPQQWQNKQRTQTTSPHSHPSSSSAAAVPPPSSSPQLAADRPPLKPSPQTTAQAGPMTPKQQHRGSAQATPQGLVQQQQGWPHQQQQQQQQQRAQPAKMEPQVVIPVASSAASAATAAASPRSDNRPLDYSSLLLSLAEEYVAAAHQLGSAVGLRAEQREANRYSRLIAMGLGCIDAVLKNFRLHPRTEATLRFRYASLLYEETENDDEAEDVLSKAITLCERNRLSDLKYSMYHLRSRIMFKSSPKAAFRALDHLIPDAEAYKHYTWVYSLRFLRASLSVQTGSHAETGHALNHLRQIMSLAETRGDTAIYVTAATLESVIHLRNGSPDAVEQSQRAIAAARSYQLQTEEDEYPQVTALLYLVDLACSLIKFTPEEASTKMKMVQQLADKCKESRSWKADGSFVILVEQAMGNQEAVNVTGGIIDKAPDGRDMLNFAWLNRRDLYVLTYLFSSVVALMKQDGKADMFIHEGLKAINGSFDPANAPKEESLTHASSRIKWVTYVRWQMRLCRAFALCNRAEWKSAKACLKSLSSDLSSTSLEVPAIIPQLCTYLEGVIFQGAGDLSAALSTYESLTSQLPASQSARSAFSAAADVATLAAFNACLILLDPEHPQHERFGELAERLERLCPEHPNPTIQSAYHLIRAAAGRNNEPMTKKKVWLQQALHKAKQAGNSQILAVSMAFMAAEFFTNILGEQAEKSAKAAKTLASRCKSGLWGVVAGAMFAETLEKHGKGREAAQMRAEVEANLGGLPEGLREKCSQG